MLHLSVPSLDHKNSFLEAAKEMYDVGEWSLPPDMLASQFETIIVQIQQAKDAATCPPNQLPHEDFWLFEDNTWVGLITLRKAIDEQHMRSGGHIGYVIRPSWRGRGYGTKLLALGLERACAYSLQRVLLTCADDNLSSRRVIEANGGKLEDIITVQGVAQPVRRYWINLEPPKPTH